jgi:hypothetical protein
VNDITGDVLLVTLADVAFLRDLDSRGLPG